MELEWNTTPLIMIMQVRGLFHLKFLMVIHFNLRGKILGMFVSIWGEPLEIWRAWRKGWAPSLRASTRARDASRAAGCALTWVRQVIKHPYLASEKKYRLLIKWGELSNASKSSFSSCFLSFSLMLREHQTRFAQEESNIPRKCTRRT